MTKSEIIKKLNERKAYFARLTETAEKSKSAEHVRAIGETLEAIKEEILDLESQLENADEEDKTGAGEVTGERSVVPDGVELRNAEIIKGAFTGTVKSEEGLALRSDETMLSRVKGDRTPLDIGKYVRGVVTGNWENADAERRAIDTSATGTIIPAVCSAQILDYARNVSLFGSAGVPTYPMDSNNLTLARLVKDPDFSFKAEGTEGAEVDFDLDSVTLQAKTCYGYCYVSLEAIESAKNLTQIITQSFGQAMANSIDKAMLYGQAKKLGSGVEDFAPAGIMNDTNVNSIVATNNGYADYIKGIGAIRRANGVPTVLGINADTEELLALLTDNNGQPLNAPKSYDELKKVVSNQLACNSETGSDALVFDPNAMAIGVQNNIRFRMITDSDECIKKGLVCFQIYSMLDCKAVRPTHISKITGIKENATV